jgi:hypothetical protein
MFIPGYDNERIIARGGFATVYRARQRTFQRDVAVKVLELSVSEERDRRRVERECGAMGRLTGHPHIVWVLDSGFTEDGRPYLTTPFYRRGSLTRRLENRGPLGPGEVLHIGVAIAGALEAAHRHGILHRDVKPGNILISPYGEPALMDFGIASLTQADPADQSQSTQAFSVEHAAPETYDGSPGSTAADVYSLASTLWMLLAGRAAFAPQTDDGLARTIYRVQREPVPPLDREDVPESLEALLVTAMAKNPDDRPASARAFGQALQVIQTELGVPVTPLRVADGDEEPGDDEAVDLSDPPGEPAAAAADPPTRSEGLDVGPDITTIVAGGALLGAAEDSAPRTAPPAKPAPWRGRMTAWDLLTPAARAVSGTDAAAATDGAERRAANERAAHRTGRQVPPTGRPVDDVTDIVSTAAIDLTGDGPAAGSSPTGRDNAAGNGAGPGSVIISGNGDRAPTAALPPAADAPTAVETPVTDKTVALDKTALDKTAIQEPVGQNGPADASSASVVEGGDGGEPDVAGRAAASEPAAEAEPEAAGRAPAPGPAADAEPAARGRSAPQPEADADADATKLAHLPPPPVASPAPRAEPPGDRTAPVPTAAPNPPPADAPPPPPPPPPRARRDGPAAPPPAWSRTDDPDPVDAIEPERLQRGAPALGPTILLIVAALVALAIMFAAMAINRRNADRDNGPNGSSQVSADGSTTAAPTTEAPTTAAPTTVVVVTTVAPTLPPPPTTAPPAPVVGAESPTVQEAAAAAQNAGTALANADWRQARALIEGLPDSDARLAADWGGLEAVTMVVIDARDNGGSTTLRLGEIAHERVNGRLRTSLYCVTWTIVNGRVVGMVDQQIIAAPWRLDVWVPPAEAVPVVQGQCTRL